MKLFKRLSLVSIWFLLAGCNMVAVQSADETNEIKSKQFTPNATKALLYVFRDDSFLGSSLESQFVVNQAVVANNEGNRFNVISLAPGTYEFLSVSAKETSALTTLIHNSNKPSLQLNVESGKIYFIQEIFKPLSGFSLQVVTPEVAEPIIKKGKLLALYQL